MLYTAVTSMLMMVGMARLEISRPTGVVVILMYCCSFLVSVCM